MEKNVPIAFILYSRWQDGAESLGIETTSCLWNCIPELLTKLHFENHEPDWPNCSLAWIMCIYFLKVGQPRPLFVYFRSFQTQFYRKTVGFSRIVGVEGEHADHLTTTTAQCAYIWKHTTHIFRLSFIYLEVENEFRPTTHSVNLVDGLFYKHQKILYKSRIHATKSYDFFSVNDKFGFGSMKLGVDL